MTNSTVTRPPPSQILAPVLLTATPSLSNTSIHVPHRLHDSKDQDSGKDPDQQDHYRFQQVHQLIQRQIRLMFIASRDPLQHFIQVTRLFSCNDHRRHKMPKRGIFPLRFMLPVSIISLQSTSRCSAVKHRWN